MTDSSVRLYSLNIGDFDKLEIDNPINVDYVCNADSAGYAVYYATAKQASAILFDNNGKGRLNVQTDIETTGYPSLPTIKVYSSKLTKVVNSGDSLVRVFNLPQCDKIQAILIGNGRLSIRDIDATKVDASIRSGNGQLILSGSCQEAVYHLVGTGVIQAESLDAVKVKASVVGTGTIGCNCTDWLTIMGVGSGKVWYRQAPPTIKSRGVGIKHGLFEEIQ